MSKEQHTPQYIKQVPWYAQDQEGKGQLIQIPTFQPKGEISSWYDRTQKGHQATTFRKGACENCGAMGHTKKDCTERPRKLNAKFTQRNIAADDIVNDLKLNWESKRDRWNGFEPEMYREVIDQYSEYEEVRKKIKTQEEGDVDAEFKFTDDPLKLASLPSKHAKNQKFQGLGGVRNREDRAKYLNNLDLNSANFDPKSRTLEGEDTFSNQLKNLDVMGQKYDLIQQNKFTLEQMEKHHAELSSSALPTLTEKIFKNMKQKMKGANTGKLGEIMDRYGVTNQQKNPMQIVYEEQEYADYNSKNLSSARQTTVRTKYEEDVLNNDHTSVWGSWYNKYLGWGYSCCYSNEKNSYCLGIKGKEKALHKEIQIKAQELKKMDKLEQTILKLQANQQKS